MRECCQCCHTSYLQAILKLFFRLREIFRNSQSIFKFQSNDPNGHLIPVLLLLQSATVLSEWWSAAHLLQPLHNAQLPRRMRGQLHISGTLWFSTNVNSLLYMFFQSHQILLHTLNLKFELPYVDDEWMHINLICLLVTKSLGAFTVVSPLGIERWSADWRNVNIAKGLSGRSRQELKMNECNTSQMVVREVVWIARFVGFTRNCEKTQPFKFQPNI